MNLKNELVTQNRYEFFSKIVPISVFVLMLFGGYVKAIGAGLACPDWPFCHQQLIPIYYGDEPFIWVLMEYVHRLIALGVTFLIITMTYQSFNFKNELRHNNPVGMRRFLLSLLITALLFIQISLGGLTIFTYLDELVVTTHLAIATLIFGLSIVHYTWVSKNYIPVKLD